MAGMYSGETETVSPIEPSSEGARRRRMEIHRFRFVASDVAVVPPLDNGRKRQKVNKILTAKSLPQLEKFVSMSKSLPCIKKVEKKVAENKETEVDLSESASISSNNIEPQGVDYDCPKFGVTSVCGRRRDMEDAVSIYPSFVQENHEKSNNVHFFGVYDGHGCSHAAMKCKDRMHEIVKNEIEINAREETWKEMMTRSFAKMDTEVVEYSKGGSGGGGGGGGGGAMNRDCRCELQTPQCDAVGSTAVVAVVTPNKIVVSNCGDSRAVLCRNGVAIPLSTDHKPDRPDELNRIEEAGGRVIYWDGARVLGVLAMSRAIGDNYLKPYVTSEPEVTITERSGEDECLILASDGLWDVVSNETACGVARMCLRSGKQPSPPRSLGNDVTPTTAVENSDKACTDASILLTRLALARRSSDNVSVVVVDLKRCL